MTNLSPVSNPTLADNIDWDLLLLLARVEASMTWPELGDCAAPSHALPDGLDLRHGGDIDWVSRVALGGDGDAARRPLSDDGPYGALR